MPPPEQHSHPEYATKEVLTGLQEEVTRVTAEIREVRTEIRGDLLGMSNRFEGWQASIASGLAALGTQLSAYQVSMPDKFIPRPEAIRQDESESRRYDELRRDVNAINQRLWAIALASIVALASALTGVHVPGIGGGH